MFVQNIPISESFPAQCELHKYNGDQHREILQHKISNARLQI